MKLSKLWIPTTLSLAILLAGCKEAARESVWVDLNAAAQVLSAEASIDWPEQIQGPKGSPQSTVTLPGFSKSVIDRAVVSNRRADALQLLAAQLVDTREKLEAAYKLQLRTSARLLAADLREALRERSSEGSEASIAAISTILESSAAVRGPIVVRLALLVGWPDDGRSDFVRFASRSGPVEESWDEEIVRLREELEVHDLWVSKRIEAVLAQFDEMLSTERATNRQLIEEATRKADAEAAEMARKRFAQTAQLTLPKLLSEDSEIIAGQGTTTVTIPGAPGEISVAPEPPPLPVPYDVLRSRLELWLRIRGYKLASGPGLAPDKTGEFIAWTHHP